MPYKQAQDYCRYTYNKSKDSSFFSFQLNNRNATIRKSPLQKD